MDNLVTLCMIGIIVIVGLALLPRLLGGGGGIPGGGMMRRGPERPRYDDPDIQSGAGFGGSQQKRSIFPRVGGFQSGSPKSGGGSSKQSWSNPSASGGTKPGSSGGSRRYDSPDVSSRGGFGGDKK